MWVIINMCTEAKFTPSFYILNHRPTTKQYFIVSGFQFIRKANFHHVFYSLCVHKFEHMYVQNSIAYPPTITQVEPGDAHSPVSRTPTRPPNCDIIQIHALLRCSASYCNRISWSIQRTAGDHAGLRCEWYQNPWGKGHEVLRDGYYTLDSINWTQGMSRTAQSTPPPSLRTNTKKLSGSSRLLQEKPTKVLYWFHGCWDTTMSSEWFR
jgi:hypothetical protein